MGLITFGVLGVSFVLALLSLFQKSFLKTEDVFGPIIVNNLQLCVCVCLGICLCMCVRGLRACALDVSDPLNETCKAQTFTIHLCVYAAVKSTNTLINHTKSSKSNVKPLLRKKRCFF